MHANLVRDIIFSLLQVSFSGLYIIMAVKTHGHSVITGRQLRGRRQVLHDATATGEAAHIGEVAATDVLHVYSSRCDTEFLKSTNI